MLDWHSIFDLFPVACFVPLLLDKKDTRFGRQHTYCILYTVDHISCMRQLFLHSWFAPRYTINWFTFNYELADVNTFESFGNG